MSESHVGVPITDSDRIDFMESDAATRLIHAGGWYSRASYGMPYKKHKSLRDAIDFLITARKKNK